MWGLTARGLTGAQPPLGGSHCLSRRGQLRSSPLTATTTAYPPFLASRGRSAGAAHAHCGGRAWRRRKLSRVLPGRGLERAEAGILEPWLRRAGGCHGQVRDAGGFWCRWSTGEVWRGVAWRCVTRRIPSAAAAEEQSAGWGVQQGSNRFWGVSEAFMPAESFDPLKFHFFWSAFVGGGGLFVQWEWWSWALAQCFAGGPASAAAAAAFAPRL